MEALWFLYYRTFVNKLKKALHKPVTYVYIVFVLFYLLMVPFSLKALAVQAGAANPGGMAAMLTLLAIWMIPANLVAYAKRKGLVYRESDIHFLFPSPITPKKVLLYAYTRGLFGKLLLLLFGVCLGGIAFHISWWRLLLYAIFSFVVETFMEGCLMMIFYGNERMTERQEKLFVVIAYGISVLLVLLGVYTYVTEGTGLAAVFTYLQSDLIKLVPIIGWYASVVHLLFLPPTVMAVVGTICYAVFTLVVFLIAWKLKCTGEFYEDAMKFADDYEEVLQKQKSGDRTAMVIGKKTKYGKVEKQNWNGTGAKALYLRQMLEYRKTRFLFFDLNTLLHLIVGIGIAAFVLFEGETADTTAFYIPGVAAYMMFVFSGFIGKWSKELLSPYTYLIPDSPFRKLYYVTLIPNLKNLIQAVLVTIPGAIVIGMSPLATLLCIVTCTAMASNRLYAYTVGEIAVGNVLGNFGKQMFQMLLQMIVLMLGVGGAFLGYFLGGVTLAFLLMAFAFLMADAIFMVLSTLNFFRLEVN